MKSNQRETSVVIGLIEAFGIVGSVIGIMALNSSVSCGDYRYGYFLPISISIAASFIPILIYIIKEGIEAYLLISRRRGV